MTTYYIADYAVAGLYAVAGTEADGYVFRNGQAPYASPNYTNNPAIEAATFDYNTVPGSGIGAITVPLPDKFTGVAALQPTQLTDYRFRLWVLPNVLQITNPQLATDIPFRLWNTNDIVETVTAITINGSAVLSYDLSVLDVINDSQLLEVNMQIASGEAVVDATTLFTTTNLSGLLTILALISDTFNIIPDVPVSETWEYKTDILRNYKGIEQRIALRRFPRVVQKVNSGNISQTGRRETYSSLFGNISIQSLVPFYQYGTHPTADASIGATRIFFDNARSNIRAGEFLIIANPTTLDLIISEVDIVEADGATLISSIGFDINRHWVIAPALNCLINNGSGMTIDTVTGRINITANSFNEPAVLRPNASRVIDTFDNLPWVNRRPKRGTSELFEFRKDVIDNQTGQRDLNSRDLHPRITGNRKFTIQRISDPDEMDYWRSFFDTIRGAQKAFLLSTWLKDLTLAVGFSSGASEIKVNEGNFSTVFAPFATWQHLQMEWNGADPTQHTITLVVANPDGTCNISFTPAIPTGVAYTTPTVISFLQKWRATDRVVFNHYANYSEVSFGVISSDD